MRHSTFRKRLEESKSIIDKQIVLGTLPTHSDYMLRCGESRGLQMALELLQEIYNHGDYNDKTNFSEY